MLLLVSSLSLRCIMKKQLNIREIIENDPELALALLEQIKDWEEFQQERAEERAKNQTK